jgi:hypothetical protein
MGTTGCCAISFPSGVRRLMCCAGTPRLTQALSRPIRASAAMALPCKDKPTPACSPMSPRISMRSAPMPCRRSAIASVRPVMPPPTIRTLIAALCMLEAIAIARQGG